MWMAIFRVKWIPTMRNGRWPDGKTDTVRATGRQVERITVKHTNKRLNNEVLHIRSFVRCQGREVCRGFAGVCAGIML